MRAKRTGRDYHGVLGYARTVRRFLLALLLFSRVALAQSAEDKAAADALFEAGKRLYDAGKYADACPKFADSQRLDPGIGTLLYLGECEHRSGKSASAAKAFRQALETAQKQNDKRAAVAKKSLDALSPSHLTIVVESAVPGLELERDGAPATAGTFEVDGGTHTIAARAPGYERFEKSATVPMESAEITITVPKLAPISSGTPHEKEKEQGATSTVAETPPRSSPLKPIGIVTASTGVAGIAIGSIFGLLALNDWNSSNDPNVGKCDPNSGGCRTQKGVDLRAEANTFGAISTVGLIAGGVLIATGVVLFLVAPSSKRVVTARGIEFAF